MYSYILTPYAAKKSSRGERYTIAIASMEFLAENIKAASQKAVAKLANFTKHSKSTFDGAKLEELHETYREKVTKVWVLKKRWYSNTWNWTPVK